MASKWNKSREERLARLQQMSEKYASLKIKSGGDSKFWKPEEGVFIVRILPPKGNMDDLFFHQQVGSHRLGSWDDGTSVRCSSFSSDMEVECPICETIELLKRGSSADKDLASLMKLQRKYWMNVLLRDAANERTEPFSTYEGPFIYAAGVKVFKRFRSYVSDPDYGDITDPLEGSDFKLERTGEKLQTEYDVKERKVRGRNVHPMIVVTEKDLELDPDLEVGEVNWDIVDKIMEHAWDLSPVLMPDDPNDDEEFTNEMGYDPILKLYSWNRTIDSYGIHPQMDLDELEDVIWANVEEAKKRREERQSGTDSSRSASRGRTTRDSGRTRASVQPRRRTADEPSSTNSKPKGKKLSAAEIKAKIKARRESAEA